MRKNERPRWALSFFFAVLFATLLGAFPVSDVLADADIDVPLMLGQELLDGGDTKAGEPKDGKDVKVCLHVAEARSEIRKVVWTCGLTDRSRPFFAGRDHVLPQQNAPPGLFL